MLTKRTTERAGVPPAAPAGASGDKTDNIPCRTAGVTLPQTPVGASRQGRAASDPAAPAASPSRHDEATIDGAGVPAAPVAAIPHGMLSPGASGDNIPCGMAGVAVPQPPAGALLPALDAHGPTGLRSRTTKATLEVAEGAGGAAATPADVSGEIIPCRMAGVSLPQPAAPAAPAGATGDTVPCRMAGVAVPQTALLPAGAPAAGALSGETYFSLV
ncbi:hypothetical protein T484DRAFT_1928985 [Baffinella frigidus]|nr:hypothetical protein T484DRAFT_1928985 [Cryptophyta sp. CCMP2293]